jgi:hypothetical protein
VYRHTDSCQCKPSRSVGSTHTAVSTTSTIRTLRCSRRSSLLCRRRPPDSTILLAIFPSCIGRLLVSIISDPATRARHSTASLPQLPTLTLGSELTVPYASLAHLAPSGRYTHTHTLTHRTHASSRLHHLSSFTPPSPAEHFHLLTPTTHAPPPTHNITPIFTSSRPHALSARQHTHTRLFIDRTHATTQSHL